MVDRHEKSRGTWVTFKWYTAKSWSSRYPKLPKMFCLRHKFGNEAFHGSAWQQVSSQVNTSAAALQKTQPNSAETLEPQKPWAMESQVTCITVISQIVRFQNLSITGSVPLTSTYLLRLPLHCLNIPAMEFGWCWPKLRLLSGYPILFSYVDFIICVKHHTHEWLWVADGLYFPKLLITGSRKHNFLWTPESA